MTYRSSTDAFLFHTTDYELVLQAQAGQLAAMHTLFERHHHIIYRYLVFMLAHPASAAELTSEVFLKAWDAIFTFQPTNDFTDWLYRIATNLTHLYQHRYLSRMRSPATPQDHLLPALNQVVFLDRACIILHDREDLSDERIARIFKMSPRKIQRLRTRGHAQFIQLLPQESPATPDAIASHLNRLAIPQAHIASPFTTNAEQPRRYVPYLTASDSYASAPRIPLTTRLTLASHKLWRPTSSRHRRMPRWSALAIICCLFALLMSSSTFATRPIVRPSCIFKNPINMSLIASNDTNATICANQSRHFQGYTFTLQQVHLNNDQLLLKYHLEDATHTQYLSSVDTIDLQIQTSNVQNRLTSSVQYACNLSSAIDTPSTSHFTFTSAATFYNIYPSLTAQHASAVSLTIAIREISMSKKYLTNSYTTLRLPGNSPLQFHFTLPPSSLPLYPSPSTLGPYDYTCHDSDLV